MAPISPCHDIEKYKRHCAFESAAYIKHLKTTTEEEEEVHYSDLQHVVRRQPPQKKSKPRLTLDVLLVQTCCK